MRDGQLVDFGKHKARSISQVDDGYLRWMLKSFSESSPWRKAAADALAAREKTKPDTCALLIDLKSCSAKRDLHWGTSLHATAVEAGSESNIYVATALVNMYAACGSMADARRVFESIQKPDVVSWTALLSGYAANGEGQVSVELFSKMKADGCVLDSVTYVAVLKACTSLAVKGGDDGKARGLQVGREIHLEIGEHLTPYVQSSLIDMYAKCGSMADARRVFDSIQKPDAVSWNAVIQGYADNGEGLVSLELFSKMKADKCSPNSVTYVACLKACTSLAEKDDASGKAHGFRMGREIHSQIGDDLDLYVQNTLVDMYAKCGSMLDARRVFDSIQKPDVVSWNAVLWGYAEHGEGHTALELFSKMKADGYTPNSITYVAALRACSSMAVKAEGLELGSRIHLEIGTHLNPHLRSALIDMYSKCGSMVNARRVFDSLQKPDVVSWTALLLGYAENGQGRTSMELFSKMKADGYTPTPVTYVAALKACISLAVNGDGEGLKMGREIHMEIGNHLNSYVRSTLINMYAKCGSMLDARQVFNSIPKPNAVSWNALLSGYAQNGDGNVCLELFSKMKADGCVPSSITYVAALKACTSLVDGKARGLEMGREIHSEIGGHLNRYLQSILTDMYAKCGSMVEARRVFDTIQRPDLVSWTALLLGYAENGEGHVSLELFSKMKADGLVPDSVTYIAVLKACGSIGALSLGRKFHSHIRDFTVHLVSCLVDFYAKCGSMVEARAVFDRHSNSRDVTTWTVLIAGYSACGDTESVFALFEAMQEEGFRPDSVTLVCVLLCCSHAGLVAKARRYLEVMPLRYGVTPDVFHYSCIVDALGRANQLMEAASMLRRMHCTPNAVTWSAFLGACSKWKNVEMGRMAFQSLVEMDKDDLSAYVVMAHIYGSRGMWEEQLSVLKSRTELANSHCVLSKNPNP